MSTDNSSACCATTRGPPWHPSRRPWASHGGRYRTAWLGSPPTGPTGADPPAPAPAPLPRPRVLHKPEGGEQRMPAFMTVAVEANQVDAVTRALRGEPAVA